MVSVTWSWHCQILITSVNYDSLNQISINWTKDVNEWLKCTHHKTESTKKALKSFTLIYPTIKHVNVAQATLWYIHCFWFAVIQCIIFCQTFILNLCKKTKDVFITRKACTLKSTCPWYHKQLCLKCLKPSRNHQPSVLSQELLQFNISHSLNLHFILPWIPGTSF